MTQTLTEETLLSRDKPTQQNIDTARHVLAELRLENLTGARYYAAILEAQAGNKRARLLLGTYANLVL